MGKYHPHGDSSIYLALVHMSQSWAYRYPLIDFQGNNGSIDGDGPAAYRYTEARLSALSNELLRDIEEDTVKMNLTFDDTLFEPDVLPARFPNLLVNGSEGIAVGIATAIPPHNLKEVTQAVVYRIKHPNCDVDALLNYIPGPDFPTGGVLYRSDSLKDIYRTGHGHLRFPDPRKGSARHRGGWLRLVHVRGRGSDIPSLRPKRDWRLWLKSQGKIRCSQQKTKRCSRN